jgi:RNA polymerase sigma-70 factor (ECF subfamily)
VDGAVGLVIAPRGRLLRVLTFTITGSTIAEIEVIADPERLRRLQLAVLEG